VFQAEVYRPEVFRKQSKVNKQGSQGVIEEQDTALLEYDHAINTSILTYNKLIEAGVAREQARSILPLGLYTEAWWTASLEAVMHFLKQREDSHAQKEIQEYAKVVRALLTPLFEKSLSHAK
jgi:thymidylate synthase (FAD)